MRSATGLRNQYGRKVIITDPVGTRTAYLVDSGSGYLNQGGYAIHVGTTFSSSHTVEAYFKDGQVVTAVVKPGEHLIIYEDGRFERSRRRRMN